MSLNVPRQMLVATDDDVRVRRDGAFKHAIVVAISGDGIDPLGRVDVRRDRRQESSISSRRSGVV